MPTVREVLARHATICADCLSEHTRSRSDVVFGELERLRIVPQEASCAACNAVTPVYSIR